MTMKTALARVLTLLLMTAVSLVRAEELAVPGSGNPEWILGRLAAEFNAGQTRHLVNVPVSVGSSGGLRALREGRATLVRVARALKSEEEAAGLVRVAFARDAVVFVVGARVSARGVSSAQAADIYAGRITDWADVGGAPGRIWVAAREEQDASHQVIREALPAFRDLTLADNAKVVNKDPDMLALLDKYGGAIGYINASSLNGARTRLQALELDAVAPTPDNLASGRYPLALELAFAYQPDRLTAAGREFMEFVFSPAGESLLRRHGLLPLPRPAGERR